MNQAECASTPARSWNASPRPRPSLSLALAFTLALTLALTLAMSLGPALAADPAPQWAVDPDHSSVNFSIDHIFAKILGRFDRFTGTVAFDPKNLAASSLAFTVETASLNTFVEKRNEHLRSADFFAVADYPTISFASKRIEEVAGQGYVVTGTLTIKGLSREVQLPLIFQGSKINPMAKDKIVAGFESKFPINLVDWRIADPKWSAMGVMGQAAEVAVYLEVLRPQ